MLAGGNTCQWVFRVYEPEVDLSMIWWWICIYIYTYDYTYYNIYIYTHIYIYLDIGVKSGVRRTLHHLTFTCPELPQLSHRIYNQAQCSNVLPAHSSLKFSGSVCWITLQGSFPRVSWPWWKLIMFLKSLAGWWFGTFVLFCQLGDRHHPNFWTVKSFPEGSTGSTTNIPEGISIISQYYPLWNTIKHY